jgi:hypothetical protein
MSSVGDAGDIPTSGKTLVIVADVGGVLHFRIFGGDGDIVADADETRLPAHAGPIADLKRRLENLWPPHQPGEGEKEQVISAVTSIVGHTHTDDFVPFKPPGVAQHLSGLANLVDRIITRWAVGEENYFNTCPEYYRDWLPGGAGGLEPPPGWVGGPEPVRPSPVLTQEDVAEMRLLAVRLEAEAGGLDPPWLYIDEGVVVERGPDVLAPAGGPPQGITWDEHSKTLNICGRSHRFREDAENQFRLLKACNDSAWEPPVDSPFINDSKYPDKSNKILKNTIDQFNSLGLRLRFFRNKGKVSWRLDPITPPSTPA